ncbi:MAG TPA: holo-ACP synthase [Gemmatimonadaceae bacterium]|nr:holo-ACP synthase [Gemmatimonadaceae bacterium]
MIVALGMDLVEIDRVRALVERHGARARERLFTPAEIAYAERRADPVPHLAARFAAKEAAFKALAGTPEARRIGWRDLEVVNEADGRPTLHLHGPAAERARAMGVTVALVTLTHTHATAAATVILVTADVSGAAPVDAARG